MKLPAIITDLINAQNSSDFNAYAKCFTSDATVFDEGHDHQGKEPIKAWIESATAKYQTVMEPTDYVVVDDQAVLTVKVSGTFPGSPIVLKYNMEIAEGLVRTLKITG
jgi:uncharacterized protein (TIGR02246 family)